MKTLHTPGPWFVCVADDDPEKAFNVFAESSSKNGRIEAKDWDNKVAAAGLNHDNYSANARLIAAAPDLLEALQDMVAGDAEAIEEAEAFGVPFPESMLATYKKARAAIAKATGESQ